MVMGTNKNSNIPTPGTARNSNVLPLGQTINQIPAYGPPFPPPPPVGLTLIGAQVNKMQSLNPK